MQSQPSNLRGFSLIELTVALLIITTLATIAVRSTNDLSFQVRYDQTKDRLEQIKQAIIGNPQRTVNGQPDISGFVADMGRLPSCLRELIDNYNCTTAATNAVWATGVCSVVGFTNQQDCVNNAGTWTPNSGGVGVGWRGPYLSVSGNPTSLDVLNDGWGRQSDNLYYGWRYEQGLNPANLGDANPANDQTDPDGVVRLVVQSLGKDQAANGLPSNDYIDDFPNNSLLNDAGVYYPNPLVNKIDWIIGISQGINVNMVKHFGENASCGFLDANKVTLNTPQKCGNAGGSWSGASCTAIDEDSCKTVGGKWQSCFFSLSTCANAGGTAQADCQFTQKSCEVLGVDSSGCALAGGVWDSVSNTCHAWDSTATARICLTNSTQSLCVNSGGTWNSGTNHCDFTPASCSLAGGAWVQNCTFTSTTCATAGGVWQSAIKPDSCSFTQAACASKSGTSNGSDCYMSHAEAVGTKYHANSCQAAAGEWTGRICMNVFFRNNGGVNVASSAPTTIEEDGANQTVQFTNFYLPDLNDIDADGDRYESLGNVTAIPMGQNAIGIYEYDGDCDPSNNPLYPASRQQPIPVHFIANSNPPIINW